MRCGAALLALAASACTVGPQHPTTTIPLPPPTRPEIIAPTTGPAQVIVADGTVQPDWWRQYRSPALDALVGRALAANNDLANADAALRQAREQAAAGAGASLPQLDAGYQAQRTRVSRTFSNPLQDPDQYLYTLHTAQVTASYPLDLFGAQRNRVRSLRAAIDVAAYKLDAARQTVVTNLVVAVVQQASLRAQADAARDAVQSDSDIVRMFRQREALGDIGASDVATQETALANAQAALPPLLKQLEHQRGLVAVLIGIAPGSSLPELPTLDQLTLPTRLPVALPAAIVAARPDVRAAEAQMRGAGADVGAAIAARLPNILLTANAGGEATRFADMFASGNPFFALIGAISQPLFHGGQLRHQQRAAEAALEAAKAQYRIAALQAFGDVSDALTALRADADALDAATRANAAADQNLLFQRRRLTLGDVGTLETFNATIAARQAQANLLQARAARMQDTASLMQATGIGSARSAQR